MPSFGIPVGFSDATMLAMELPAGAWVLNGKVGLSAFSSSPALAEMVCQMSQDGSSETLDGAQQSVYLPTPVPQYFTVPLQATVTLTEPTIVRLTCRQFGTAPTSVENAFGTKLAATQVTTQTRTFATSPDS